MKTKILSIVIAAIFAVVLSCSNANNGSKSDAKTDNSDVLAKNKAIVQQLNDAFDKGDTTKVDSIVAKDFVEHNPSQGHTGKGSWELKQDIIMYHTAIPAKATIKATVAEGDMVSQFGNVDGTNSGPMMGMPATGKHTSFDISDFFRIKDGKIVEHWGLADEVKMMKDLGVWPAPKMDGDMADKKMDKKK